MPDASLYLETQWTRCPLPYRHGPELTTRFIRNREPQSGPGTNFVPLTALDIASTASSRLLVATTMVSFCSLHPSRPVASPAAFARTQMF